MCTVIRRTWTHFWTWLSATTWRSSRTPPKRTAPNTAVAAPVASACAKQPAAPLPPKRDPVTFLGVVAEKEWNAVKAAQALKVTWSESKPNFPGHDKVYDHIRQAPVVKRSSDPGIVGFAVQRDQGVLA